MKRLYRKLYNRIMRRRGKLIVDGTISARHMTMENLRDVRMPKLDG